MSSHLPGTFLQVLRHGCGLSSGSDSELITQLLSHSPPCGEPDGPDWPARIKQLMSYTLTAYSLLVMHKDTIYAVRDPYGNRPLCIGKLVTACAWSSSSGKHNCFSYISMVTNKNKLCAF